MARSACVPVPHVVGSRALELRLVAGSMADPVGERYAAARLSDGAYSLAIRTAPALPILGHGLCKNARAVPCSFVPRGPVAGRDRDRILASSTQDGVGVVSVMVSRSEPLLY